jgi:hypothetical protein
MDALLFRFGPHPHLAIVFVLNMDDVRSAADRTILDILLSIAHRQFYGDHDILAASIADVAGFV